MAQGTLVNPAQRLAFKLKEPHIRALDGLGIALTAPAIAHVTSNAAAIVISARKTTLAQLAIAVGLGADAFHPVYLLQVCLCVRRGYTRCKTLRTCIQTRSKKRSIRYFTTSTRDRAVFMPVAPEVELNSGFHAGPNQSIADRAAFTLFMADMAVISPFYGQRQLGTSR